MKKRTQHLLIGSGITAVMMAVAESARQGVAGYFVDMALNRKAPPYPPGTAKKISGSCVDADALERIRLAGDKLAAQSHETVEIQARDGIRLLGHWVAADHPRRVVLAMHGWRSSWSHDFGMIADFLRRSGCSVLYAEQRGQGGSGGDYMGFGLQERYDCLDWINWIDRRTGGKEDIYLCGVSMGASTVLMAGGLELPQSVRGIVADCGYTSPVAIWKYVAKNHLHLAYSVCGGPAGRRAKKKISMAVDCETCPHALSRCCVPVLFIHGTDDHFVPIEMTYENYKACSAPKRLLIVPGAEHGMSYLADRVGYEGAVRGFWAEFDQN